MLSEYCDVVGTLVVGGWVDMETIFSIDWGERKGPFFFFLLFIVWLILLGFDTRR